MRIAPQSDEFELSVFGRGAGECLVVHLGNDEWIVVDSFNSVNGSEPVALEYLREIGVNYKSQVKLILITHWDADHYRGAAALLRACEKANFACSGALMSRDFLALALVDDDIDSDLGIPEFREILGVLNERMESGFAIGPDTWASHGKNLFHRTGSAAVDVIALSPSDRAVTQAVLTLSSLVPKIEDKRKRPTRIDSNDVSVVVMVAGVGSEFLLGADLKFVSDPNRGWTAIINSPHVAASSFCGIKVSHHGDPRGDHAILWSQLMGQNACALVAPFSGSSPPRPDASDVARIKTRTANAYCTGYPPRRRAPRTGTVNKTMDEVAVSRSELRRTNGHIRFRVPINGSAPPQVDLFEGAVKL